MKSIPGLLSRLVITTLLATSLQAVAQEGLVLWNTLDSQQAVENSPVGPGGTANGAIFAAGIISNAYMAGPDDDNRIRFPASVVNTPQGCIEVWARLSGFPQDLGWGDRPSLFKLTDGSQTYQIHFTGHDDMSCGGVCGRAGQGYACGTAYFGIWNYSRALAPLAVDQWHHYALVWNSARLPGMSDASRTLAVYVDGRMNSTYWYNGWHQEPRNFNPVTSGTLDLVENTLSQGTVMLDNLKVWNVARTNFADSLADWPGYVPATNAVSPTNSQAHVTNTLVLWNRLESPDSVTNSEVGPAGLIVRGSFTNGVFGMAYEAGPTNDNCVLFPKEVINVGAGCIEIWARLRDFPALIPWGKRPGLFEATDGTQHYQIHINGNDGASGGGVCGQAGFGYACGTTVFTSSSTYGSALNGGDPTLWHHYALVWSSNGIPSIGDGTRKLAIYVDGELNTGYWGAYADPADFNFNELLSGNLSLVENWHDQGFVAIDNLKVWNFAKTDFSDRLDESAGAFIKGDLDRDGRVTVFGDFTLAMKIVNGVVAPTVYHMQVGDIDLDGVISKEDAQWIHDTAIDHLKIGKVHFTNEPGKGPVATIDYHCDVVTNQATIDAPGATRGFFRIKQTEPGTTNFVIEFAPGLDGQEWQDTQP